MFLKDVLEKCRENNCNVTASGLYFAGNKYGFLKKSDDNFHYTLDKEKFFQWIKKYNEKIPEGYVTLKEYSDNNPEISIGTVYNLIKDEDSGVIKVGEKGIMYVHPDRIKAVIDKRKNSHKEQWEEVDGE